MKKLLSIVFTGMLLTTLLSCGKDRPTERKVQYMGDIDMYNPVPYETYSTSPVFENGISAQLPVEGTIARGTSVYDYPDSEEGYQMAKDSLRSPLEATEKVECIRFLEYGKRIKMVETQYMGIEIDTPEDLDKAQKYIKD